ncbi:MAG: sulfotransferase [Pikeienuella sp.]|uniref:sulfotransferase n=1 Tax=Pikeienuella sp. TaxID=2831957 RepID=UPI00391A92A7
MIVATGLSRTGTTSLHLACLSFGFAGIHYPDREAIPWLNGRFTDEIFSRYDIVSDAPVPAYWRRLREVRPDLRVIHTRRNVETWIGSVRRHWAATGPSSQYTLLRDQIRLAVYGVIGFDEAIMRYVFERHDDSVMSEMSGRADFLCIDLDDGFDMKALSRFLGKSEEGAPKAPHARSPRIGALADLPRARVKAAAPHLQAFLSRLAAEPQ